MDRLRALMEQLRNLFRRRHAAAELDEEMRFHLEMEEHANLRKGMTPEEARRQAVISFGGEDWFAERVRDVWWGAWIEDLMRDLRFGARNLRRRPAFAVAAVVTLSVGIGMTTTMFALVDSVLLRPLPGSNAEGIVYLELRNDDGGITASPTPQFLRMLRENASSFSRIEAYTTEEFAVTVGGEPVRARGAHVSAGFFSFLGVTPVLGRSFLSEDATGTASPVVLLSHSLWVQRFGRSRGVLGRTLGVNGRAYEIVGVLPRDFRVDSREQALLWIPEATGDDLLAEGTPVDGAMARLAAGVSPEAAQAELDALVRNNPLSRLGGMEWHGKVQAPAGLTDPSLRRAILLLQAAAILVLLIGCGNLVNLLLAQGEGRARELALRASLGAGRGRLLRQLLAESLLLGVSGGAGGLLLTLWTVGVLPSFLPPVYPGVAAHSHVFLFAAAATLFSVSAVGLLPALKGSDRRLGGALRGEVGRKGFLRRGGTRQLLVTVEVAMTVLLLISAGLLIKSFTRLTRMDTGFDRRDLLTVRVELPQETYEDDASRLAFFDRLQDGLRHGLPDQLGSPTVASGLVQDLGAAFSALAAEGAEGEEEAPHVVITWAVAPGYFKVLGVPILGGRGFTDDDTPGGEKVVVVNQTVAGRYFPGRDPVGQRIRMDDTWYRVLGVAGSIRLPDLAQNGVGDLQLFFPLRQNPRRGLTIITRVRGGRSATIEALKGIVWKIDRSVPIQTVARVDDLLAESVAQPRSNALLMVLFGTTALALGAVGVYGVVAYSVNRRIREMGIRLALGASSKEVVARVILDSMKTVGTGVALGVGGMLASGAALSRLLYQVNPRDPWVFLLVLSVTVAVSVLSSWLPTRRVAGSAPLEALRSE
jgi:predicted permease